MTRVPAIDPNKSYTFADYFKLNAEPDDILSYFGYGYMAQALELPKANHPLERLPSLKQRLAESLPYVSLTSEMARREFLIAPVLMDLIYYTKTKVKVAYALTVSDQLKGELNYLLQLNQQLLIVEAKNADLQHGFTQLAGELIALEQAGLLARLPLYRSVSMGNVWQFAYLTREPRTIIQDINLFRVPADLAELFQIMIGILELVRSPNYLA